MRIAVISDIHSNYHALTTILQDIANQEIDKTYCCGDLVGYGSEPNRVVRALLEDRIPCVRGNHDEAIFNDNVINGFNPRAYGSILQTRKDLDSLSRSYLSNLAPFILDGDIRFVHGFPPDSFRVYVSEAFKKSRLFFNETMHDTLDTIVFVGHTHALGVYSYDGFMVKKYSFVDDHIVLDRECKHIVNVGSVGEPRGREEFGSYVIFDDDDYSVTARRIDISYACSDD